MGLTVVIQTVSPKLVVFSYVHIVIDYWQNHLSISLWDIKVKKEKAMIFILLTSIDSAFFKQAELL